MSTVWFTSDLHIGHGKVAEIRATHLTEGSDAVEWHDTLLARQWDSHVNPDDQIWILGDLSAGGARAETRALQWISERPGHKHLIPGNHDSCHPMHRNSHRRLPAFLEVFESVQAFARRRIGHPILLSHFPYHGDHTEVPRFDQYRLRDNGAPLLHGHTHNANRISRSANDSTQIHVGVDAWEMRPAHINEIAELIGGGRAEKEAM